VIRRAWRPGAKDRIRRMLVGFDQRETKIVSPRNRVIVERKQSRLISQRLSGGSCARGCGGTLRLDHQRACSGRKRARQELSP
jgi:hypothetical protein